MMLLMGMKMSLTKKPTNPITTNPIAVRNATFVNSIHINVFYHQIKKIRPNFINKSKSKKKKIEKGGTFTIGLVASFHEANAIPRELSQGVHHWVNRVHFSLSTDN